MFDLVQPGHKLTKDETDFFNGAVRVWRMNREACRAHAADIAARKAELDAHVTTDGGHTWTYPR
jgi:hypothetical protein